MKQNYKLLLSYDGSRYYGFERQREQELTIQGKLESVLTAMPTIRSLLRAFQQVAPMQVYTLGECVAMCFWIRI